MTALTAFQRDYVKSFSNVLQLSSSDVDALMSTDRKLAVALTLMDLTNQIKAEKKPAVRFVASRSHFQQQVIHGALDKLKYHGGSWSWYCQALGIPKEKLVDVLKLSLRAAAEADAKLRSGSGSERETYFANARRALEIRLKTKGVSSVLLFTGGVESGIAAYTLGNSAARVKIELPEEYRKSAVVTMGLVAVASSAFTDATTVFHGNAADPMTKQRDQQDDSPDTSVGTHQLSEEFNHRFRFSYSTDGGLSVFSPIAAWTRVELFQKLLQERCLPYVHSCFNDQLTGPEATWCGECFKCFEVWHMIRAVSGSTPLWLPKSEHLARWASEIKACLANEMEDVYSCTPVPFELRERFGYSVVSSTEELVSWYASGSKKPFGQYCQYCEKIGCIPEFCSCSHHIQGSHDE